MVVIENDGKTRRLIVIDDDDDALTIARRCLKKSDANFSMQEYSDAENFLNHIKDLKKNEEDTQIWIFLDIKMPGCNGFEVLKALNKHPEIREDLKIIMVTSSSNPRDIERAKALNADGYVIKPLEVNDYVNFFNEFEINGWENYMFDKEETSR